MGNKIKFMVKSLALNFWLNYIKMLKIVIIVSNTLGWNAKRTSLVQFHSVTPELAIKSCQKYTQNPDTNAIFRISRQTRSPKSIMILPSFLEKNPYRFLRNIQKLPTKPFISQMYVVKEVEKMAMIRANLHGCVQLNFRDVPHLPGQEGGGNLCY